MEEVLSPSSIPIVVSVLVKLGAAVLLGGMIGFEREIHGRPAGLRTHILVAIGVVLFCVVSTAYAGSDPTRISAQVVTGIGFLGAGTILRMGAEVKGLTSAASIWATSAISMAIARGGPYLIIAAVSTIIVLVTLGYIEHIEKRYRRSEHPREMVVTLEHREDLHDLIAKLNYEDFEVQAVRIVRGEPSPQVALQVTGSATVAIQCAAGVHGVTDAHWSDGN